MQIIHTRAFRNNVSISLCIYTRTYKHCINYCGHIIPCFCICTFKHAHPLTTHSHRHTDSRAHSHIHKHFWLQNPENQLKQQFFIFQFVPFIEPFQKRTRPHTPASHGNHLLQHYYHGFKSGCKQKTLQRLVCFCFKPASMLRKSATYKSFERANTIDT